MRRQMGGLVLVLVFVERHPSTRTGTRPPICHDPAPCPYTHRDALAKMGRNCTHSLYYLYVILGTGQTSGDRKKAMFMKRFTQPFRQLQGKLTLSYTLT